MRPDAVDGTGNTWLGLLADPRLPKGLALAAGVCALAAGLWMVRVLQLRRREPPRTLDLGFDLNTLGESGPPATRPRLFVRGVPVRLALVVLAPAGRNRPRPTTTDIADALDRLRPGLARVAQGHGARLLLWPPQLSTAGFTAALWSNVPLPGGQQRASPWLAVAGKVERGEGALLVGLFVRADQPQGLERHIVERPADWQGLVDVRD